jgi:RimJ/RimL family protein N-acetyltransferase
MTESLFEGKLIRLCLTDKQKDAALWAKWNNDSDYYRLMDTGPAGLMPVSQIEEWIVEEASDNESTFSIHTLIDDRIIGSIGLFGFNRDAGSAWVGIGIGDPYYRGKGYGTDAMKVLLNYAFNELNLHRVNLGVFEFNQRAIRSYEKCGFKYEGSEREFIFKEDKRWSIQNMGILRSEWQEMQG